jgi:TPR repeat protein
MTLSDALRILELVQPYTEVQLKTAFREQLMVWHPDRFGGNDNLRLKAQSRTCQINEAFALLSRAGQPSKPQPTSPHQAAPNKPNPHPPQRPSPTSPQKPRPAPARRAPSPARPPANQWTASSITSLINCIPNRFWWWCVGCLVFSVLILIVLNRDTAKTPDEALKLGRNYLFGFNTDKNPTRAIYWLSIAADQGSPQAISQLASAHRAGLLGPKDDIAAMEVYRKYADRGDADAQVELGWCYIRGDGVEKNGLEGFRWWKQAALRGNPKAQELVGTWLFEGADGIPKDIPDGLHWYEKAAWNGVVDAQFTLGDLYCDGEKGVPRDYLKAKQWLQQAIDGGHKLAKTVFETNEIRRLIDIGPVTTAAAVSVPNLNPPTISPDDSLTHRTSDYRLTSGTVLVDNVSSLGGKGKITLDNGLTEDALVKMIKGGRLAVSFYVRGGQRHTFSQIPDGSYEVLYCTGFAWDSAKRDFSRGRNAHKYLRAYPANGSIGCKEVRRRAMMPMKAM